MKCVETLAGQKSFDSWNVPDCNGDTPIMTALMRNEQWNSETVEILLRCPRVDLDVVAVDKKHLDELTEEKLILDQLWSYRSVQQRMILRDSLLTRQAGSVSSLQSLSRDAVLLILATNNSQERLVTPLVDRLEGEITPQARDLLLKIAAEDNYPELLEILLSHPKNEINNTTEYAGSQYTGLMFACQLGNSAIVSRLVEVTGLDINYQDEIVDCTPLFWALMETLTLWTS